MWYAIFFLAGFALAWIIFESLKRVRQKNEQHSVNAEAKIINQAQVDQKQEHLKKILEMAKDYPELTNNIVEKVLGVSNASAERYLNELEQKGALEQVGEIGQGVFYRLKQ